MYSVLLLAVCLVVHASADSLVDDDGNLYWGYADDDNVDDDDYVIGGGPGSLAPELTLEEPELPTLEIDPLPTLEIEPLPEAPLLDCIRSGSPYLGQISQTVSGRTCQRWNSETPQANTVFENSPFDGDETADTAVNYCRELEDLKYDSEGRLDENYGYPGQYDGKPWCYTMDPEVRWEFCEVPQCPEEPEVECIESTKVYGANIRLAYGINHLTLTDQEECLDACDQYPSCASIEFNAGSGKCQLNSRALSDADPRGTYSKWTYCPRR